MLYNGKKAEIKKYNMFKNLNVKKVIPVVLSVVVTALFVFAIVDGASYLGIDSTGGSNLRVDGQSVLWGKTKIGQGGVSSGNIFEVFPGGGESGTASFFVKYNGDVGIQSGKQFCMGSVCRSSIGGAPFTWGSIRDHRDEVYQALVSTGFQNNCPIWTGTQREIYVRLSDTYGTVDGLGISCHTTTYNTYSPVPSLDSPSLAYAICASKNLFVQSNSIVAYTEGSGAYIYQDFVGSISCF